MLKIAICDDSGVDAERVEDALDAIKDYKIEYDVFYKAGELWNQVEKNNEKYSVYILDIEMPGMTGMELAEKIRSKDQHGLFVFLTSYPEYALQAFDYVTFSYILKPITDDKMRQVIDKIMHHLNLTKKEFSFTFNKAHFRVPCEDIIYLEKTGRKLNIHTQEKEYVTNMATKEAWNQLDDKVFVHIHSAVIINLEYVTEIRQDTVYLKDGTQLPITRAHKQNLKDRHMNFMRGLL